ncbi:MAG: exodeoxyribonuclease III [Bacteroidetes bacterium GWF2_38_335]|nr:MAG: exodeoxyribonuclease III [Bacteroidetes bacterium GWF2_38_335]OFY81322.1 MAG: exodeoxyribonuclease III [Bacteroidetes bacterium RIFOXYA12_FULL_38_20]HBS85444.1 exodeoxyribonuclease III [Bacteroidales bacterium]
MKILSYNVNGIRAAMKKGFIEWLKKESPDILCIQEIKAEKEQIETLQFEYAGYLHQTWFSAGKKGYSGTAVLSKTQPDKVISGMGIERYDSEGRLIRADFGDITIINSYFPSGTTGDERQDFKMKYLYDFLEYLTNLKSERKKIIVSGDFNICHKPIDINHPQKHTKMSGFLPEEREWFDKIIGSGFVDSFRMFNDLPEQYSWWSYRQNSRQKNLGWRIDYHLVTENLKSSVHKASILSSVEHSDHCPVCVEIN